MTLTVGVWVFGWGVQWIPLRIETRAESEIPLTLDSITQLGILADPRQLQAILLAPERLQRLIMLLPDEVRSDARLAIDPRYAEVRVELSPIAGRRLLVALEIVSTRSSTGRQLVSALCSEAVRLLREQIPQTRAAAPRQVPEAVVQATARLEALRRRLAEIEAEQRQTDVQAELRRLERIQLALRDLTAQRDVLQLSQTTRLRDRQPSPAEPPPDRDATLAGSRAPHTVHKPTLLADPQAQERRLHQLADQLDELREQERGLLAREARRRGLRQELQQINEQIVVGERQRRIAETMTDVSPAQAASAIQHWQSDTHAQLITVRRHAWQRAGAFVVGVVAWMALVGGLRRRAPTVTRGDSTATSVGSPVQVSVVAADYALESRRNAA